MAVIRPFDKLLYNITDKQNNVIDYIQYMLMRTRQMFHYENLPDTIPENMLEYYLQMGGVACITEVNGKLYALTGGWGGEPDAYYRPTKFTVANPALNFSETLTLGQDAVLIYNDSRYCGLRSLFERYATALAENDISIWIADIQARVISLITAGDDRSRESAELYLRNIIDGKLGVIGDNLILESIKSLPYNSTAHQTITDLIELHQYLKASWWNDLGLNANYNMKREAINAQEAQLGKEALLPLIDDMLHCREEWVAQVNALYGTDIKVGYHSAWADVQEEELEQAMGVDIVEGEQNDETTENQTITEEETVAEASVTDEEPVTEEPVTEEPVSEEPVSEDDSQLEEQDYEPDEERAVEDEDHVIEVPVTDEEVEEAGDTEDGDQLIDQEIVQDGTINPGNGSWESESDGETVAEQSETDDTQEDYNRNLQKRAKRGNL